MSRRKVLAAGLVAVFGVAGITGHAAAASDFPGNRPITIVVPFPPGGTSDLMGRVMAKGMQERLGVTVLVENKGGGGTLIGSQHVARSAPDGHTLLLAATPHAINATMYKNIPYDTRKDFYTVAHLAETPLVVSVSNDSPVKSVADLVKEIKSNNKNATYGSSGVGGSPHLATELFLKEIQGDATHVPYRGSNPAVMDLIAGRTTFTFDTLYLMMSQADAGKLRPIATTGKERHSRAPNLPTLAESGYPGFEVTSWFTLVAPGGTPMDVIHKLNKAANDTLKDPEVKAFLTDKGMDITGGSAEDAQARLLREIDQWAEAVKISGATME
ncbi:MAG: Bug family tripartite tricarboxylate transporter substrate binding protein [Burkholderiaceae bacterium]